MKYILWNMKVGCKSIGIKNKALVTNSNQPCHDFNFFSITILIYYYLLSISFNQSGDTDFG